MGLNDHGKLAVLLSAVVGSVVLAIAGKVSGEGALGVILVVVGYVTGNGVLAVKRKAPSTVLAPKLPSTRELEEEVGD